MPLLGKRRHHRAELNGGTDCAFRLIETPHKLVRFMRYVIPVETVEAGVPISVSLQECLPFGPGRRQAVGCKRLNDDDLGTEVFSQSPLNRTSFSEPSTSIFRNSNVRGAYRWQSSASVSTGMQRGRDFLPNCARADLAFASIMVERPCHSSTT